MFCKNCGRNSEDSEKFCVVCGDMLVADESKKNDNDKNAEEFNSIDEAVGTDVNKSAVHDEHRKSLNKKITAIIIAVLCGVVAIVLAVSLAGTPSKNEDSYDEEMLILQAEDCILYENYTEALEYIDNIRNSKKAEVIEAFINFHKVTKKFMAKCEEIDLTSKDNDLLITAYDEIIVAMDEFEEKYIPDRLPEQLKKYYYKYSAATKYVEETYGLNGCLYWETYDALYDLQMPSVNNLIRYKSYYNKNVYYTLRELQSNLEKAESASEMMSNYSFKITDPMVIEYCNVSLSQDGTYEPEYSMLMFSLGGYFPSESSITSTYLLCERLAIEDSLEKHDLDAKLGLTSEMTTYPFESFRGDCYTKIYDVSDLSVNATEHMEVLKLKLFFNLVCE